MSPGTAITFLVVGSALFAQSRQDSQPAPVGPGVVQTVQAVGGLPPDICNIFRDPVAIRQLASGDFYVFDRRAHAVYRVPSGGGSPRKVVDIGGEQGNLLLPTAFDASADGRFAVADAPGGQERLQVFDATGKWTNGFFLPGKAQTRVSIGGVAFGGVSSLSLRGRTLTINQPESGALITEYGFDGTPLRSVGTLRATGHEDRQLHLALNTGLPLPHPDGGYLFVFVAGTPLFRRYNAAGALIYERVMQGRELDPVLQEMPRAWPRRVADGSELPLVTPTVRAAALDRRGDLWVAFQAPVLYGFDADGEKIRTVELRGAGVVPAASLHFLANNRLMVTPGCYEYDVR